MNNTARPGYTERDGVRTGAGTINNINGLEGAEGKIDIIMLDKTNKTSILVSY